MDQDLSPFRDYFWNELYRMTRIPALPSRALVLDCAAGEGGLLNTIQQQTPDVRLYGLERNIHAIASARQHGFRMLLGEPGDRIVVQPSAFSCIILPALTEHDEIWCQWARRHLVPGGTLLATVYPKRLGAFVRATRGFEWRGALSLAPRSSWHRIVVGLSQEPHWRLTSVTRRLFRDIEHDPQPLQALEQAAIDGWSGRTTAWDQLRFPVRPADLTTFATRWQDADTMTRLLSQSTFAADSLTAALRPLDARHALPPLPLKAGHLALQLVTGAFDGPVGTGDHRHVVRGRVVRQPYVSEEEGPDGPITITTDRLQLEITALDRTGTLVRYGSALEEE